MEKYIAIACGGALGALARTMVGEWVMARLGPYPFGTITVNLIGCLIIGIILGAYLCRPDWPQWVRFFLVVGGLGAFTTFSTFAFELLQLLTSGDFTDVLFYGAVQILGGLAFVPSVCGLLNSYVHKCIISRYHSYDIVNVLLYITFDIHEIEYILKG